MAAALRSRQARAERPTLDLKSGRAR
jgi:hypothetical protein